MTSTLIDYGIPNGDSSMSRTVALPVAIASRMILEGKITLTGVHRPIMPEVYEPILKETSNEKLAMDACLHASEANPLLKIKPPTKSKDEDEIKEEQKDPMAMIRLKAPVVMEWHEVMELKRYAKLVAKEGKVDVDFDFKDLFNSTDKKKDFRSASVGRFHGSNLSYTFEGAMQVSHFISITQHNRNEKDYFTTVEEFKGDKIRIE